MSSRLKSPMWRAAPGGNTVGGFFVASTAITVIAVPLRLRRQWLCLALHSFLAWVRFCVLTLQTFEARVIKRIHVCLHRGLCI